MGKPLILKDLNDSNLEVVAPIVIGITIHDEDNYCTFVWPGVLDGGCPADGMEDVIKDGIASVFNGFATDSIRDTPPESRKMRKILRRHIRERS